MRPDPAIAWRRRDRAFSLVAPLLLAAVALAQAVAVHGYHLSPWKGGGFGMFSTIDQAGRRPVFAYLHDGDRREAIDLQQARELGPTVAQARALPTPGALQALAERIGRLPWGRREADGRPTVVRTPDGTITPVTVARVEVEVWRLIPRPEERGIGRLLLARGEWRSPAAPSPR